MTCKSFIYALVLGSFGFVITASADEIAEAPSALSVQWTNSVALKVSVNAETVADLPPVNRAIVKSTVGKFSFLLPRGYRVDGPASKHVTFVSKQYDRFLKLRVIGDLPPSAKPLHHDLFQELLARQYPKARVVSKSVAHAGNKTGPGFNLEWTTRGVAPQSARILYFPCGMGVLEISLITSTAQFDQGLKELNKLLLTMRSAGPKDELVFSQLSSRL